jgi:PAS domain S-box-containing protein
MSQSQDLATRSTVGQPAASTQTSAKTFTRAQIDAVREMALSISASLKVEQSLSIVAEHTARLMKAAACLIYLVDVPTGKLRLIAGQNIPDQSIGLMLEPDEDIVGHAALSGLPQTATDEVAHQEIVKTMQRIAPDLITSNKFSAAAVPLTYSRQVLGVLEVISRTGSNLDEHQVALLELIAPQAATAVIHAQLFDRNQQVMSLLELINDRAAAVSSVGQAVINAGHNLMRMSSTVLARTIAALHLAGGKVFLNNPVTRHLTGIASENLPKDDSVAGLELAATHCLNLGQTILLQSITTQAWTHEVVQWLSDRSFGSLVCIPLLADNEPVGVLQVVAKIGQPLDTGTLDTLHIIAGQLALGIANAGLFDRVRAEQQQLAAILSSSSDALIGLDAAGNLKLANPAAERAFNFEARQHLNKPLSQATPNVALNNAVETAIHSQRAESAALEIPINDDQTLFCNLSPIIDPDGKLSGWVGVMQDITFFKEAERAKSDMILTVSHDLRNPLNLILGALELLGRNSADFNNLQREAYDLAMLGTHRVEALISELLDLERIERRIDLKLIKCDLADITRSVVDEMRLPAQQRNQKLWLTLASTGSIPQVRGDAQRLYQIVSNLVGNAIKYTPDRGEVAVSIWTEDNLVRLDVHDNGVGIPAEAQARLFQRFYRAPNVAPEQQGTGLGLAIVKSIVDQHGGQVWVTSAINKGSTFSVSLPIWIEVISEE